MRWLLLALVLGTGCGGSGINGTSKQLDGPDAGWVITGDSPNRILLTNGGLAVWVQTDRGIDQRATGTSLDGAYASFNGADAYPMEPLKSDERHTWSFDLRRGILTTERDYQGRIVTAKYVMAGGRPEVVCVGLPGRLGISAGGKFPIAGESTTDVDVFYSETNLGLKQKSLTLIIDNEYLDRRTFTEVAKESVQHMRDFWETDIEIDGPAEDQLAIRTMLYYLRRGASDKLPPFGASNAKYRGARFWDAEAWMLPVLAVVDKEKAERATRWRLDNLGGYVPWEAAVGGKDVTPKEFGNALHVAGWVAWWANRAKLLGLATEDDEKKVLEVAFTQYYKAASSTPQPPPHFQRNKEGEFGMEIKGVESPDEGRLRDNDLVTNLLAKRVARLAADHGIADGEDLEWFNSIKIPKAQDGLPATYDNDLLKGYQQTAALLALYPLEEDFDKGVAEKMFDRYADLTSEVGPAMSESIHATIAARLKRRDAYARWRKSWQTYTDDAMMFHERRNKQDAYFMTGAAGCLQTVLYGFAGIHIEKEGISAPASKSLGNGYQVAFRPNLPAEWKSITLRNVFLGPTRATVRITHSGVTIE